MRLEDSYGTRIQSARESAGLTQRDIASKTGIAQARLSRIENGQLTPKINETVAIAAATGATVGQLLGRSTVRDRALCFARSTADGQSNGMQEELLFFLELDAQLTAEGISTPA